MTEKEPDMKTEVLAERIAQAEQWIRPYILTTPLMYSDPLTSGTGAKCYLKLENRQHTGSFKVRGALHKVLRIGNDTGKDIVTASTGNHGLGVARALSITGLRGRIFVPETVSRSKLEALRGAAAEIIIYGKDSLETEIHAKKTALQSRAHWISPYNDVDIIAGQGTVGVEILEQLQDVSAVYVTVGGGGLISGIGTWISVNSPQTKIIGCLPENSPEMKMSVEAGHIVHIANPEPTLSDGSAGGLEDGAITFGICRELVDKFVLVSEEEIAKAIRETFLLHNERLEGAAGVAVAAMLKDASVHSGGNVVAVVCGGNIEDRTFDNIIHL